MEQVLGNFEINGIMVVIPFFFFSLVLVSYNVKMKVKVDDHIIQLTYSGGKLFMALLIIIPHFQIRFWYGCHFGALVLWMLTYIIIWYWAE